jgi:ChrR Cupin-like domain
VHEHRKRIVTNHFDELEFRPQAELSGFEGAPLAPGVQAKYFGEGGDGPWFYIVRHAPGVRVPRHAHKGDVTHYMLEGEWLVEGERLTAGHYQFEEAGTWFGPVEAGPAGAMLIAFWDQYPSFIPWSPGVDDWVPPADYWEWAPGRPDEGG